MTGINRGSEWRKWDLHLHSPYNLIKGKGTFPNVTSEEDVEKVNREFIKKVKEAGLSVVGLTNYIKFDDRDFILKSELEKAGIVVFLNLELRLTSTNKEEQLLDYHIILDNKLSEASIKLLLSNLVVQTGDTSVTANDVDEKNIDKAALDFSSISEVLKREHLHLEGKYLTAFLSRGHGHAIGEGKNQTVYERVARESDIVLHSSSLLENLEDDRQRWLYEMPYVKPVLQSSDAHCFKAIGVEKRQIEAKHSDKQGVYLENGKYFVDTANYSWIKADLSFDGLRQILFEPEGRIAYGTNSPDMKPDYLIIDNIRFKNKQIYLNSGLNTIIGGRSTGKSTLLKTIAKFQGINSGIDYTLMDEEYDDFFVEWRDHQQNPEREVEFISQNYMQEIADNPQKLNEIVKGILKEKNQIVNEDFYQQKVNNLILELSEKVREYLNILSQYQSLMKPEGDLVGITQQIDNLDTQIQGIEINSNFFSQKKIEFENLEQEISKNESKRLNLEQEMNKLKYIKSLHPFFTLNSSFYTTMEQLDVELKFQFDKEINQLISDSNTKIKEFIDQKLAELSVRKNEISHQLEVYRGTPLYQTGLIMRKSNSTLSSLYQQREQELDKKIKIEHYELEKKRLKEKYSRQIDELVSEFSKYQSLVDELAKNYEVLASEELKIKLKVSKVPFEDKIDYLNGRDRINNEFISNFDETEIDSDNFKELLKKVFFTEFNFNRNQELANLIQDIFTNNWFKYDYEIEYQGDKFEHMSQGKKAFVVLQLLLDFSDNKKPILIDQPEDSLDNRAIYNELRQYFIKKKAERQIIVVTHNPNIVVGADAENVIVANQHSSQTPNKNGIKFDYFNGALENSKIKDTTVSETLYQQGIREHVFEILEGGKEAFEKREKKYNMK